MNIAILGYGKMGKEVERIALQRGHKIVLRSTEKEPFTADELKETDVAIEFTAPEAAVKNFMKCFEADTPVVTGTTGWYNRFNEVEQICKDGNHAFFYASNFSLGVNLFFELNKRLTEMMNRFPEYDASLREIHHTEKKDAPSGTAISLAEDLIYLSDRYESWVLDTESEEKELPIEALREAGVHGTHEISWTNEIDQIQIKHTAFSRKGFAMGAVLAAEWLKDKKGVYTMRHLIDLEK
jgi:4-hydroxy-tetrahydrodipicolinate reductase